MLRLLLLLLVVGGMLACQQEASYAETSVQQSAIDNAAVQDAFLHKLSHVIVSGHGTVIKLLADDNHGARHQRFLLRINTRQTLLFAHNIDLAKRLPLKVGDQVTFQGEYIYNPKGGIMHWTHHDPAGRHAAGWIKLNDQVFN